MRPLILILFINCLYVACDAPNQPVLDEEQSTTATIFNGGDILTMQGVEPLYVESVVVDNEKIVFVGALNDAKKSYPNAKSYDLKSKVMMPGFIEPHVHPSIASTVLPNKIIAPHDWALPKGIQKGVKSKSEYHKTLINAITGQKKEEMFLTWGYHQLWHGELSREVIIQDNFAFCLNRSNYLQMELSIVSSCR